MGSGSSGDQCDTPADQRHARYQPAEEEETGRPSHDPAQRHSCQTDQEGSDSQPVGAAAGQKCTRTLLGPRECARVARWETVEEEPEHHHEADGRAELQRHRTEMSGHGPRAVSLPA